MELVVFVGLPGSGKSTYYQRELSSTHTLVSKDRMSPHNRRVQQKAQIAEALQKGRSVAVDNTNPTRADRKELIELGRALGARVVCLYFPLPAKDCVARNQQREGKARVPNVAIFAIAKKLEPPSLDEGFDELRLIEN
jgi:predicted kinase